MSKYSKINLTLIAIGLVGVVMVLSGVMFQDHFPWATFKDDRFLPANEDKVWEWVYYQISPFVLKSRAETGASSTSWFFRTNMTAAGVICYIGAGIAVIGVVFMKRKTSIFSVGMILFSMIFFGTSLPGVYPYFSWALGAQNTFYGAMIILLSVILGIFYDDYDMNRTLAFELIKKWQSK